MFGRLPPQPIFFCGCFVIVESVRKYLPQVKVNAHTTILDTTSRTTLTQTFVNPNKDNALDQIKYVFPIYDGVSVVGFTCTVGDRVIKGVVKEREKAKQVYDEATARGETAGLFEQSLEAADVFTTTIGNVPAGEKIVVDITYLGELKHDAEVDGVRFTIPDHIVPRYGSADSLSSTGTIDEGFTITVDAEMPEGSAIKSIQSPSHPISVSIGTTSKEPSADPSLRKASATLSRSAANLDVDFIVQVVATKMGEPAAFVETHSTIPNQRAIMATLVPKFKLPAEKPEIVFLCDRSGSMSGTIPDLVAALRIFLKSLPVGVKFNICSFGSNFDFLWSKSKTYSQESLDKAVRHVDSFSANYGGTQMVEPLRATFDRRYKDLNLEVFLLTDGAIWDQEKLFDLINEKVAESKGAIRVFSLGVGSGASTALIEGAARAGNGFSQTVGDNEKMDKKVVRMLKGALFPHITDYSLEIKYEKAEPNDADDDDDFEVVEKVMDALSIHTLVEKEDDEKKVEEKPKEKISLFDKNVDDDDDTEMTDAPASVDTKYDHLPAITPPRYLQTPSSIPPLFPFNRTTVYVLLSDATPTQNPKSVVLRGTSKHGPLELEIPIVNLTEKSTTIHQLAARKEVKELEEGRGWITLAKDDAGKLLKEKHESHFSDMVEREAVRLGVEFQVGGKWCSFVAAEETEQSSSDGSKNKNTAEGTRELIDLVTQRGERLQSLDASSANLSAAPAPAPSAPSGGLFGSAQSAPSGGLFGSAQSAPSGGLLRSARRASASVPPPPPPPQQSEAQNFPLPDDLLCEMDSGFEAPPAERVKTESASTVDTSDPLQALTSLQTFVGSWTWNETLEKVLGVTSASASKLSLSDAAASHADRNTILATMCAVVFFKKNLKAEKDVWEMLVDKAESWLEDQLGEGVEDLEKAVEGLF
ncbi:von Willebrand factor type A domain-containing protein [Dactylonectria estremocensis]|uniref:von Willebrand factor type A domain-containing protein n=1 Tax=Dactylonectria estremocensis TaxID=1079267 RepID=A0A9P9EFU9_9HYPO|nr:von Willebrand factor type A domain-containing protein [Dactylonectria estremocensis]